MFDRVTFDAKIMGGRACIRGMRVPVSTIVNQIAHGATFDDVLAGYPDLTRKLIPDSKFQIPILDPPRLWNLESGIWNFDCT